MSLMDNPIFGSIIRDAQAKSNATPATPALNPQPVARPRPVREPAEAIVRATPNFGSSRRPMALDSFKKGTPYVPETGLYQLHEGEAVIPKDKTP